MFMITSESDRDEVGNDHIRADMTFDSYLQKRVASLPITPSRGEDDKNRYAKVIHIYSPIIDISVEVDRMYVRIPAYISSRIVSGSSNHMSVPSTMISSSNGLILLSVNQSHLISDSRKVTNNFNNRLMQKQHQGLSSFYPMGSSCFNGEDIMSNQHHIFHHHIQ